DFKISDEGPQGTLKLDLKYGPHNELVITGIRRISKPGHRQYKPSNQIPAVMNGLGIAILTTSKGVITDKQAREQNIGGELLCEVW
ncbi:MAG: 30S ribosomal protein S8, partial [Desulfobulbus sp.]